MSAVKLEMSRTELEMHKSDRDVIVWDKWWESFPPFSGADRRGLQVKIVEVRDEEVLVETLKHPSTCAVPISEFSQLKTFDQFVFDVMHQPMEGR